MKALVGVYLRFLAVLFLLFSATLLLIRIQPRDDHELRQLLLPDGCPAPCFMGIRPGVTTRDEAVRLLEMSKWVMSYEFDPLLPLIRVKWNDNNPSWLKNDGLYNGSVIWIDAGLVDAVMLDTTLTLGDLQLLFGRTVFQTISTSYFEDGGAYLFYSAYYSKFGTSTTIWGDCDGKRKHITYQDIVYLGYSKFKNQADFLNKYQDSWSDVLHMSCGQH